MRRFDHFSQNAPQNWAEWLILLGRTIHIRLRRGVEMEDISRQLQATSAKCRIALDFFHRSDVVKLRAMVEDWPLARIIGK